MFAHCLFCHRELPRNEALEHFPVARRIAFDPARGRLWAVCPACRRWNLAPIEERWEALEELERTVKDRARLLSQTDNIALLRTPELELVRVGRANLAEEAWWRYGVELVRRRRLYKALTAAGVAGVLGVIAGVGAAGVGVVGSWYLVARAGRQLPKLTRTLKFGQTAWRGRMRCAVCGGELREIPFRTRGALEARRLEGGELGLQLRCLDCEYGPTGRRERALLATTAVGHRVVSGVLGRGGGATTAPSPFRRGPDGSGFLLTGVEAEHLLRRVLAYQNFAGAKEADLRHATALIQSAGSAAALARRFDGRGLSQLGVTEAIAMEIAVNEDHERRLLELELAALEARWKEEEEIAAIADGELTWLPGAPATAPGDRASPA